MAKQPLTGEIKLRIPPEWKRRVRCRVRCRTGGSDAGRASEDGRAASSGGEELMVRVRNAQMFVIGQEIKVRDAGDVLILHGKQPTRRGRA